MDLNRLRAAVTGAASVLALVATVVAGVKWR